MHEARKDRMVALGLAIVVISLLLAVAGPWIAPYDPMEANPRLISQPPSRQHWFGTDRSGMDIFSRVISAPRVDVSIALASTVLSAVVGSGIGVLTGFYRGRWTEWVMRVSDILQAFPVFILAMILVALAGPNMLNIIIAVAFLNTPIYLRLMRSQVLALRERLYVDAARATGNSELAIAIGHVLPNALGPIVAQSTVTMGWAILLTAGLSFIGAGVRPPTPEWGSMIALGANDIIIGEWWPSVFPGIAISLTVFGWALVGDRLERLLDPRRRYQ